jgi:hypothetical protein
MTRFAVFLLLLVSCASQARVATLTIERVSLPLGRIDGVAVRLGDDAGLELTAKTLDASGLGYRFRDLRWRCGLERGAAGGWSCRGALRARGAGSATLAATWRDGVLDLALTGRGGELGMAFADPWLLRGVKLPAAWLQPLLATRWPEATLTGGRVDSRLAFGATPARGVSMAGPLAVSALGLDTRDGRIAAAALDAEGSVGFDFDPDATAITLDLALAGGELLAGPLYASLPESRIDVGIDARGGADGRWSLARIAWHDPGVLQLDATATLAPSAEPPLLALDATARLPDLAAATPRYLATLLATLGLDGLALEGAATLKAARTAAGWQSMELEAAAVDARDGARRFAIEDLAGALRWSAGAPQAGELRWKSARLYEATLGAAVLPLRSEAGGIALAAPASIDLLGGQLAIPRFAWRPGALDAALSLRKLQMREVSQALGWPAFAGTLSGELPGLHYADEVLGFEGGLAVDVFDGRVDIKELTLERPLGVAPTLTARIALDGLDLKPLTEAFGFGEITGRLDGHVDGLRLVDWQPVGFDAALRTDAAAKDARRISQRAVQDLSTVGGAGFVAGLQGRVLKLFETFPYAAIGLSCRLANNVCEMAGLDSSDGGYTIVEGSGLPRITVVGHQRRVDWPVLVARLKAATEGQTPIVD